MEAKAMMCEWKVDDDGIYQTDCGHTFIFTDDGPIENQQKFCGYCGKLLKAERVRPLPSPPAQATAEKETMHGLNMIPLPAPSPLTARVTARLTFDLIHAALQAGDQAYLKDKRELWQVSHKNRARLEAVRAAILAAIQPELQDAERELAELQATHKRYKDDTDAMHDMWQADRDALADAERRLREAEARAAALLNWCNETTATPGLRFDDTMRQGVIWAKQFVKNVLTAKGHP